MAFVYFIRCGRKNGSPIKIGVANNIDKRMADLQIANPYELSLVLSFEFDSRKHAEMVEKKIHRFFKSQHIRGEWFTGNININKCLKRYEGVIEKG